MQQPPLHSKPKFSQDVPSRFLFGLMGIGAGTVGVMFAAMLCRDIFAPGAKTTAFTVLLFVLPAIWVLVMARLWRRWVRTHGYDPKAVFRAIAFANSRHEIDEALRREQARREKR